MIGDSVEIKVKKLSLQNGQTRLYIEQREDGLYGFDLSFENGMVSVGSVFCYKTFDDCLKGVYSKVVDKTQTEVYGMIHDFKEMLK